jgi:hypothetical protein
MSAFVNSQIPTPSTYAGRIPSGRAEELVVIAAFHQARTMLRMPGRGQPRRDFAQKAERRARFALGYLVILSVMLIIIFVALMRL